MASLCKKKKKKEINNCPFASHVTPYQIKQREKKKNMFKVTSGKRNSTLVPNSSMYGYRKEYKVAYTPIEG